MENDHRHFRLPRVVSPHAYPNFELSNAISRSVIALFQLTGVMSYTFTRTAGFLSISLSAFGFLYGCILLVNFSPARMRNIGSSEYGDTQGSEGDAGEGMSESNAFSRFRWANVRTSRNILQPD
jgi:hypothetical protein